MNGTDIRHRVYYLVNLNQNHGINWWSYGYDNYGIVYEKNLSILKSKVPSIKVRPYGEKDSFDRYWQLKISCKIEESQVLVDLLNRLSKASYVRI